MEPLPGVMGMLSRIPKKKLTAAALVAATVVVIVVSGDAADAITVAILGAAIAALGWMVAASQRSAHAEIRSLREQVRYLQNQSLTIETVRAVVAGDRARAEKRARERDMKEVRRWEQALWAGHVSMATDGLTNLSRDRSAWAAARGRALLALAKWAIHEERYADAYGHTLAARMIRPSLVNAGSDQPALEADCLMALGRVEEARQLLSSPRHAGDPNLRLRIANCERGDERLAWMNTVFSQSGFAPLGKRQTGEPLTLENVTTNISTSKVRTPVTVSVIVPAFNAEASIATALRSLQEQTWADLEVIVVDDGSDDETARVAESVAAEDPRFRVIRLQYNSGPYAARNAGRREATGQFITVHDADDWSHAQKLETQVRPLLDSRDLVATLSSAVRCTEELKAVTFSRPRRKLVTLNSSSLMVRCHVFEDVGEWDHVRASADSEFIYRVEAYYGPDFVRHVSPETPLMLARVVATSLTSASSTGIFTLWRENGPRRRYREAYEAWHASETFRTTLPWFPTEHPRPFHCPRELQFDERAPARVGGDSSE